MACYPQITQITQMRFAKRSRTDPEPSRADRRTAAQFLPLRGQWLINERRFCYSSVKLAQNDQDDIER